MISYWYHISALEKKNKDDVREGDPKGLREEFEAIVFVNSDCFYFHIAIWNDFLLIAYFRWTSPEFACYKTSKDVLTTPYQKEDEA